MFPGQRKKNKKTKSMIANNRRETLYMINNSVFAIKHGFGREFYNYKINSNVNEKRRKRRAPLDEEVALKTPQLRKNHTDGDCRRHHHDDDVFANDDGDGNNKTNSDGDCNEIASVSDNGEVADVCNNTDIVDLFNKTPLTNFPIMIDYEYNTDRIIRDFDYFYDNMEEEKESSVEPSEIFYVSTTDKDIGENSSEKNRSESRSLQSSQSLSQQQQQLLLQQDPVSTIVDIAKKNKLLEREQEKAGVSKEKEEGYMSESVERDEQKCGKKKLRTPDSYDDGDCNNNHLKNKREKKIKSKYNSGNVEIVCRNENNRSSSSISSSALECDLIDIDTAIVGGDSPAASVIANRKEESKKSNNTAIEMKQTCIDIAADFKNPSKWSKKCKINQIDDDDKIKKPKKAKRTISVKKSNNNNCGCDDDDGRNDSFKNNKFEIVNQEDVTKQNIAKQSALSLVFYSRTFRVDNFIKSITKVEDSDKRKEMIMDKIRDMENHKLVVLSYVLNRENDKILELDMSSIKREIGENKWRRRMDDITSELNKKSLLEVLMSINSLKIKIIKEFLILMNINTDALVKEQ
ncbi:uncharacterized protein LOC112591505 [Melanaphis sacchari]|uniref:uncharacterized protein LOC112591505 n=1 Tax=Melanaphis sacchari TaxID=742174 RepID=UPI000DC15033|nr:uncharacterized protein LOC112591505 [Melanaphis sacchari]